MAAWITESTPDLVVHLGDITADGVSDPAELDAAFAIFAALARPMRFLPGNHDIGDNPLETGPPPEHPLDLGRRAHYRRVFGPDRWALEAGAWRIVGLNAQLFGTCLDEETAQVDWLDAELRAARGPVGVLLHNPCSAMGRTTRRRTSATSRPARGAGCSPASRPTTSGS